MSVRVPNRDNASASFPQPGTRPARPLLDMNWTVVSEPSSRGPYDGKRHWLCLGGGATHHTCEHTRQTNQRSGDPRAVFTDARRLVAPWATRRGGRSAGHSASNVAY